MKRIRNSNINHYLSLRVPASNHTGSLKGQLFFEDMGRYCGAEEVPTDAEYYIYSYRTPIAWFKAGMWVIPDCSYSPTTSRHQNIARAAAVRTGYPLAHAQEPASKAPSSLQPTILRFDCLIEMDSEGD